MEALVHVILAIKGTIQVQDLHHVHNVQTDIEMEMEQHQNQNVQNQSQQDII
jgi:hypothetical protein